VLIWPISVLAARGPCTPPRKTTPRQSGTTGAMPITDGDVKWAVVQVDEAAERLKAAEHAMLGAQRELAAQRRSGFSSASTPRMGVQPACRAPALHPPMPAYASTTRITTPRRLGQDRA
jgi:hypothetical protein